MDPNSAMALIMDDGEHPETRFAALDGLSHWARIGGFLPKLTKADRWLLDLSVRDFEFRVEGYRAEDVHALLDTVLDMAEGAK